MKIAVEGCAHGELEKIYDTIELLEKQEGIKVDLLICCGDFQATRNLQDLNCMAIPQKYWDMCSFYKYYSGEKTAPVLTLFIGGNHEASNHLQELSYGGWAAPNIYYLGYAGVVNFGGLRIAGLSGIYKGRDYMRGHYERAPYCEESKRSVYHVRNLEVFRLKQLSQPVDIMLSHDWPRGITNYGDSEILLRKKPFFRRDIEENSLGSKPAEELLHELKPTYWFAAHLHCKFPALVSHGPRKGVTKFLALDKCLPRRKFLQIVEVEQDGSQPLTLSYDLEWLAILHITNHLLSIKKGLNYMPAQSDSERWIFTPTNEEKNHVLKRFGGDLTIPHNFSCTVAAHSTDSGGSEQTQLTAQTSPQTTTFCERVGVDDPMALLLEGCSQDSTPKSWELPEGLTPDRPSQVSFTDEESPLNSFEGVSRLTDGDSESGGRRGSLPVKRLSMSLPAPRLVLPDREEEDCLPLAPLQSQESLTQPLSSSEATPTPLQGQLSNCEACSENSTEANSRSEEELTPSTPPLSQTDSELARPPKKFKRRNQAIYTSTDDD